MKTTDYEIENIIRESDPELLGIIVECSEQVAAGDRGSAEEENIRRRTAEYAGARMGKESAFAVADYPAAFFVNLQKYADMVMDVQVTYRTPEPGERIECSLRMGDYPFLTVPGATHEISVAPIDGEIGSAGWEEELIMQLRDFMSTEQEEFLPLHFTDEWEEMVSNADFTIECDEHDLDLSKLSEPGFIDKLEERMTRAGKEEEFGKLIKAFLDENSETSARTGRHSLEDSALYRLILTADAYHLL